MMRRRAVQFIQFRRRRPEESPYGNLPGATTLCVVLFIDHLCLNRNTDYFLRSRIIQNLLKRGIIRALSSFLGRRYTGRSTCEKHILSKSKHSLLSPKGPIGCSLQIDVNGGRPGHAEAYQHPSREQGHSVNAFTNGHPRNLHSGKLTSSRQPVKLSSFFKKILNRPSAPCSCSVPLPSMNKAQLPR